MNKLEELEKKYKELGKEIEALKNHKIDFSKWIGRFGDTLAIKGEEYLLKSHKNGNIIFSDSNRCLYNDAVDYEVVNMSELKRGDLFLSVDTQGNYRTQYLKIAFGVDSVDTCYESGDKKIKRVLRE